MSVQEPAAYNRTAIWTVAICFAIIIGYFTLNAFAVHGWIPGLKSADLDPVFRALPIVGLIGLIQCFRIGGGTSDLLFLNLDGVIGPHDPRIKEFEANNQRHGRSLTALVAIGSGFFLIMIFVGVIQLFPHP